MVAVQDDFRVAQHLNKLDDLTVGMIELNLLLQGNASHKARMAVRHNQSSNGFWVTILLYWAQTCPKRSFVGLLTFEMRLSMLMASRRSA